VTHGPAIGEIGGQPGKDTRMRLDVPVLTTARLVVRPFALGDLEAVVQLIDVELYPERPGASATDEQRAARERWLRWTVLSYEQLARMYQPPYGDRAVCLRDGGEIVGAVGYAPCLHPFGQVGLGDAPPMGHSAEVGLYWAVAPGQRGKGYAVEAAQGLIDFAFAEMHLHRIVATTEYDNLASQRVMEKLGMELRRNPLDGPPWLQVVGVLVNGGTK
jgi:ribosomal-protein-alanine N-acetyltransferase